MQLREAGNAFIIALISIILMIGALSISLVEFVPELAPTFTSTVFPSPIPLTVTSTPMVTDTQVVVVVAPTFTPEPTFTPTITVTYPSSCNIPTGWGAIVVQAGETLDSIAIRYRVDKTQLSNGNCLLTNSLVPGTVLYVPPVPANTVAVCAPGAVGWARSYTIKGGDTLYSIALNYYTTANLLKSVNCRDSDRIYPGEVLWVPGVATRTPYPTPLPGVTVTPYPTAPLTETALPFTTTPFPSETPIPVTPTAMPTNTLAPVPTASPTAFPP
jgi:LysM repeat protein